jgi:hypothetical protein
MKHGDKERLQVLRMILSPLQLAEKEATDELSEDDEIKVLMAEKKRRVQAADGFRQGGREESALKEDEEAKLIDTYLPRGLDEAELEAIVAEGINEVGASGIQDMGKVMSAVMPRIAGRADGKVVSDMVKQRLSG